MAGRAFVDISKDKFPRNSPQLWDLPISSVRSFSRTTKVLKSSFQTLFLPSCLSSRVACGKALFVSSSPMPCGYLQPKEKAPGPLCDVIIQFLYLHAGKKESCAVGQERPGPTWPSCRLRWCQQTELLGSALLTACKAGPAMEPEGRLSPTQPAQLVL